MTQVVSTDEGTRPRPRWARAACRCARPTAVLLAVILFMLEVSIAGTPSNSGGEYYWGPMASQSHPPILIESDDEFTPENGVVGGLGTWIDPYVIEGWTIDGSDGHGLQIRNTKSAFVVRTMSIGCRSGPYVAIWFINVSNGGVERAEVESCSRGIVVSNSHNVTIEDSVVSESGDKGVDIASSREIGILRNEVRLSRGAGLYVWRSDGTQIRENKISRNDIGIFLSETTDTLLSGNSLTQDGVVVSGGTLSHYTSHTIESSNSVSGRPILYYRDCNGITVDGRILGQLILANCTGASATNLRVQDTDWGIELAFVNGFRLADSVINHNQGGVFLYSASNISLEENRISSNLIGLEVRSSTEVNVTRNSFTDNSQVGAWFFSSDMLRVYHNDFLENGEESFLLPPRRIQAYDFGGLQNQWDNGYPSGGNYWSDYSGEDRCSGVDQDVCPDPDGVGDEAYWVGMTDDRYPLIEAFGPVNLRPSAFLEVLPDRGNITTSFAMDASRSADPEDLVEDLEVRWDFEDDGIFDTPWSREKLVRHSYDQPGFYFVRLQVRDTGGRSNQTVQQVTVANTPPSAYFEVAPQSGFPGTAFRFNASASSDLEDPNDDLLFRWDWEDDGVWDTRWSPNETTSHSFAQAGDFTSRLEVRDTDRQSATFTRVITVLSPLLIIGPSVVLIGGVLAALVYLFWWRPRKEAEPDTGPLREAASGSLPRPL